MTEESAVRVCVRVRPLIAREESAASENEEPVHFWKADQKSIHQIDDGNSTKSFSFDRVFTADETTSQLYHTIAKPLVVSTVEGYNGTIFAYGQTSSGKTFTMMGSDRTPGVIPLAVEDVFQTIKNFPNKEFLLRVSYMEIYNETVTDLLVDSWKRKPLEVREQINKTIYVADLTEELVTSPSQVLAWIRKGEKNRHYGKTKMNQRSSRSHTIFRMILESREMGDSTSSESGDGAIIVSHLNLVDLAGSERASQTGAEGARFKEGCNINRSLFILGQVIKKLTDENQKGFTNYRDSKLTRILQNSLGGNAKTVIICTITPAALDETLSTLQFASTAKKMKNDPHVTEVSDDGALLKRYRNEIVDLKRRLHEVSSVTQTTVTEKEVLSQLLQEKDQLQREQEDRIRNLTKLLVTGSNLVPIHKVPKRRVTWGGKMLKLGHASACVGGSSDLSFAESFTRKRKVDFCLTELGEDDEDFDSNWGIPDEPSDEMEISQSSVTIRSFGESPRDFVSPDRMQELSGKVSSLEMQLERESQQKEEAVSKVEALDGRVAELQLQLQTEAQQKGETLEKMQAAEQQAAELQLQLQAEAQQRLEAMDRVDVLESRVRDLERQLGEGSNSDPDANEQMRREFAETIQLCETLASEKDMLVTERDYLRQELGMFIEQTDSLEKEKAVLSQQLREKMELEEFRFLEAECTREQEKELQSEISSLKMAVESSELQCLELQNKLETLSEQLKEKTEFAEELQNLSGKDLVEEVAKLRRSLNDAEGLSKDTMKEWAVLRSQNIALEETNVALTASQEKMEAEMKSLRSQLETEKARYKKMQSDLQKELNVAFDENTKLTSLLDGRVPKNLIDSVELERTVASLNKELTESREAEKTLTAHLDELASFQNLPDKVDGLMKQLEDGEQQRAALEGKLSEMQQLLKDLQEKLADSEVSRTTEEEISRELQEQVSQLNEELQCVRAEKAALLCEQSAGVQRSAEETEKLLSTLTSLSAQRDQLELKLLEHVDMVAEKQVVLQSLQHELQEQKEKNSNLMKASEQKESELGEHTLRLSQELQAVREEKEALLTTAAQRSSEEVENLLATVASLTAERDQLKLDLQENVEMMIENQEELRTALEKNREQKKQIKELETAQLSKVDGPPSDMNTQLLELQTHMKTLTEEFENVRAERDVLLLEKEANAQTSTEEMEQLQSRVTSISEERDQLQEILEALRQEKQQLRAEMEDRMDTLQAEVGTLTLKLQTIEAERDHLLSEKEAQTSTEEMEQLQGRVTSISEERDQLQEILEALRQEKQQLRAELEDRMEMFVQVQSELNQPETLTSELQAYNERERQLQREVEQLQAALQAVTAQKNQVEGDLQSSKEMAAETQSLLHSLQEQLKEQNQRNAHLERVGQEGRAQLEQQVEETNCLVQRLQEELQKQSEQVKLYEQEQLDFVQKMKTLTEEFENVRAERDVLLLEKEANAQTSTEEMEQLQSRVTSISEERDQLQEILEALRQEKQQLRAETEDRMDNLQAEVGTLTLKLQTIEAERDHLLSEKEAQTSTEEMEQLQGRVTSISEERDQLQEILEALRQEKQQLRAELEDRMDTLQAETAQLNMSLQAEGDQKRQLENDLLQSMDTVRTLAEKLERAEAEINGLLAEKQLNAQTSTEEMEQLQGRVTSISEERDQLQEILEALRQEKQQLRAETEDRMDTLQAEVGTLTLKLQTIEAERDHLLSEKEAQTSTEEVEQLQSRVTSLSEERDQLQEILEALREEKQQLRAELEDRVETISAIQEKLSQQEQLQSERGEQEAKLQQDVLQLEQQLQMYKEKQDQAESEAGVSQQLLSEANATISALREQLSSLEQSTRGVQESVSSRLQESTDQLEESFKRFQLFIDSISGYKLVTQQALREQHSLKCTSPPKATKDTYDAIFQLGQATDDTLRKIQVQLCVQAQAYKNMFEELVRKDLAVFEEKRLHDVMLCKAQAPSYSVKDEDFHALWEHRLPELLDRRQLYLQKMSSILGTFKHRMTSYLLELKAEIPERADFTTQLQALIANQPVSFSGLDSILSPELDRRTAGTQRKKLLLQSIIDETTGPFEELKQMEAQAEAQLREVKSKNFTLLEALGGVPLKSTISLLKDNQQLVFQLQQAEEQVKALRVHTEQLEEAQVKANKRVSNHKEATQLLQTELQDSRALVEKQENTIQTLKSKLRESEKKTSPSAAELEKLQTKLMQMEMKLSSASSEHQQEIQKMTTLLREKEELLRKLKETLRKSQQEGEESFLQGKDLHARLTNPKGSVISSSVLLEKSKLEEEVRRLQGKLAEQESLVSSQQAEISKWKNRAIKLKVRSKAEVDKPPSPSTPTKRAPPVTLDSSSLLNSPKKFWMTPKKFLDSPRKVLESPNKFLDAPQVLNSPKSRFFDMGGSAEMLSRSCPKQFFDNSSLGTVPDAAVDVGRKDEWWPASPKQEEMCKTQ